MHRGGFRFHEINKRWLNLPKQNELLLEKPSNTMISPRPYLTVTSITQHYIHSTTRHIANRHHAHPQQATHDKTKRKLAHKQSPVYSFNRNDTYPPLYGESICIPGTNIPVIHMHTTTAVKSITHHSPYEIRNTMVNGHTSHISRCLPITQLSDGCRGM